MDEEKFTSKGFKSVRSRVTNILPMLPEPISVEEFIDALRGALSGTETSSLDEAQLSEIRGLRDEKYATWEWNWGASPEFTERKVHRFPWGKVEALLNIKEGVIRQARFYGDYFGSENREEIERLLEGRFYREEALREALEGFPLERSFKGAGTEEFLTFLMS